MRDFCKKYYKWGLALIIIIAVGIVGEMIYNQPVNRQIDYQYLEPAQVEAEGFDFDGEIYYREVGGGEIRLSFEEQFVDKLYYRFESAIPMDVKIYVMLLDENGHSAGDRVEIRDNNDYIWGASTVNIRQRTNEITMVLPSDARGTTIADIAINNTTNRSWARMAFSSLVAAFALLLVGIAFKKINLKIEWIFLSAALSIGCLMLAVMPSHKVGADEEIHFKRAFYLDDTLMGRQEVMVTPEMEALITTSVANWPYSVPQSEEEHKKEREYWNSHLSYDLEKSPNAIAQAGPGFQLYSFAYLSQGVMIKVGQLLRLDFATIFMMGRLGNLLLYCGVIFLAIRHIAVGKRIMMVLALMPTAMFSATTYSYDAFVTAFSFLGIAYLITELVTYDKIISTKNCVIFSVALVLASFPKPIYIPMIALALFFPASKFRNKQQMWKFKGLIGGIFLVMMSTFMLPPLLQPNRGGDTRGGDTNIGQQLRFVFAQPWQYTKLLLGNVIDRFLPYTFSKAGLGNMGHLTTLQSTIPIATLVGYVAVTDGKGNKEYQIKGKYKIVIAVISLAIMCLIWTALYLSFTPVGANVINGVQGRYYLPITMMLLLVMGIKSFRDFIGENIDLAIISAASIGLLMVTIFAPLIVNSF